MKPQEHQTYFHTYGAAVRYAKEDAERRGYSVVDQSQILSPVNYGQTERIIYELISASKPQRKSLVVILYRMDSGMYELTHYIN